MTVKKLYQAMLGNHLNVLRSQIHVLFSPLCSFIYLFTNLPQNGREELKICSKNQL